MKTRPSAERREASCWSLVAGPNRAKSLASGWRGGLGREEKKRCFYGRKIKILPLLTGASG